MIVERAFSRERPAKGSCCVRLQPEPSCESRLAAAGLPPGCRRIENLGKSREHQCFPVRSLLVKWTVSCTDVVLQGWTPAGQGSCRFLQGWIPADSCTDGFLQIPAQAHSCTGRFPALGPGPSGRAMAWELCGRGMYGSGPSTGCAFSDFANFGWFS